MGIETLVEVKDWTEEYLIEQPKKQSDYFSDTVPEGELIFKGEIKFLTEGIEKINNFNTPVVFFEIEFEGKKLKWDVSKKQWQILKEIAKAKPLIGKTAILQRQGSNQTDTKRTIKFK